MFDVATRPQPARANAGAVFGVPFDWRLVSHSAGTEALVTAGVVNLATFALELEDTLQTAIILSLFTDRRAGPDDKLPLNETDRRGWAGDEFARAGFDQVDAWGSRLWLCYVGKSESQVLEAARFAAAESLAWLVRDGIASRVDVATQWTGQAANRLAVRPTIYKPGQVRPVYDVLWGTSLMKGAA